MEEAGPQGDELLDQLEKENLLEDDAGKGGAQ